MNEKVINFVTALGTTFIGLLFLTWWLLHNPVKDFLESVREAGRDSEEPISTISARKISNLPAVGTMLDRTFSGPSTWEKVMLLQLFPMDGFISWIMTKRRKRMFCAVFLLTMEKRFGGGDTNCT
jgi:hypothetical protein